MKMISGLFLLLTLAFYGCSTGSSDSFVELKEGRYEVVRLTFKSDYVLPPDMKVKSLVLDDGSWEEFNADGDLINAGRYRTNEDGSQEVNWSFSAMMDNSDLGSSVFRTRFKKDKYVIKIYRGDNDAYIGTLTVR